MVEKHTHNKHKTFKKQASSTYINNW